MRVVRWGDGGTIRYRGQLGGRVIRGGDNWDSWRGTGAAGGDNWGQFVEHGGS